MSLFHKLFLIRQALGAGDYKSRASIRKLREKLRLSGIQRYTPAVTGILGQEIAMVDAASFLFMYGEVFEQQIYKFTAKTARPRIIDCGANIGLSVIYFKQLCPQSQITAFEPDSSVFNVLKENLAVFGYGDVECVPKALWDTEAEHSFLHEGADGGRLPRKEDSGDIRKVPTVRLRSYLNETVDFLKLDIEGAETIVLKDCADLLCNVENLFVEYHSFVNEPQTFNIVIDIMSRAGFRLHIHPPLVSPQPFCHRNIHFGMDMQLNIFGFREK